MNKKKRRKGESSGTEFRESLIVMRFLFDKLWWFGARPSRWTNKIIIIINAYIRKSTNSTLLNFASIVIIIVVFRIKTTT